VFDQFQINLDRKHSERIVGEDKYVQSFPLSGKRGC
jgi:hypothetical protein